MRYLFSFLCLGLLLVQCQQAFSADFPFGKTLIHDTGDVTWEITIFKLGGDEYEVRGEVRVNSNIEFLRWRTSHLRLLLGANEKLLDKVYIPVKKKTGRSMYFDTRFKTDVEFKQAYLHTNLSAQVE